MMTPTFTRDMARWISANTKPNTPARRKCLGLADFIGAASNRLHGNKKEYTSAGFLELVEREDDTAKRT